MQKRFTAPWRLFFIYPLAIFASLAFIAFYAGSWRNLDLKSHSGIIEGRSPHDGVSSSLAKRSAEYDKAVTKGNKLHCLMGMTQEEAKRANGGISVESPNYLQTFPGIDETEGWNINYKDPDHDAPWFGAYLNEAFTGLGIDEELHHEGWCDEGPGQIFENPDDPDIDNYFEHWPTGAFYFTSYMLNAGVVIGDNAQSVKFTFSERFPGFEDVASRQLTNLQQWSDVAWMQWLKACEEKPDNVNNINYIFQAQITNAVTLKILAEALLKWGDRGVTIGKWKNRITLDVGKDEDKEAFYAFLGSPHGSMSSYLLLNHKEKLGVRTINKVDIFVPNIPWTIIGEGVSDSMRSAKISCVFHVTTL